MPSEELFQKLEKCLRHSLSVMWSPGRCLSFTGYVDYGKFEQALFCFEQMQREHLSPGPVPVTCILKACGNMGALGKGQEEMALQLYRQMLEANKRPNAMLSAYVDCGQGDNALMFYGHLCKKDLSPGLLTLVIAFQACGLFAFSALSEHDVVAWNALLSAYVEQGQGIKALQLCRQMQDQGPNSSQLTLTMALQACNQLAEAEDAVSLKGQAVKVRCLDLGKALHADAKEEGYASELVVGNTLTSTYGKCGALMEAKDVFHAIPDCNIVSWNVLLSTCVEQGRGEKVFQIYRQIQKQEVVLNDVTLTCMLQVCASTGSLKMCQQLHFTKLCAAYDEVQYTSASTKESVVVALNAGKEITRYALEWILSNVVQLRDGQVVAEKQHKLASSQGDVEFCSEVEVLSCAQHRDVCLEWLAHQKIAAGAARGLRYLNKECRVGCRQPLWNAVIGLHEQLEQRQEMLVVGAVQSARKAVVRSRCGTKDRMIDEAAERAKSMAREWKQELPETVEVDTQIYQVENNLWKLFGNGVAWNRGTVEFEKELWKLFGDEVARDQEEKGTVEFEELWKLFGEDQDEESLSKMDQESQDHIPRQLTGQVSRKIPIKDR